jgi:hypothetical protein
MESRPTASASTTVETAPSLAEDLPELYRLILDRVAGLERIGARAEAGRIRADATRAYSNAWDESARRTLAQLLARADRAYAAPDGARGWSLRRRPAPSR